MSASGVGTSAYAAHRLLGRSRDRNLQFFLLDFFGKVLGAILEIFLNLMRKFICTSSFQTELFTELTLCGRDHRYAFMFEEVTFKNEHDSVIYCYNKLAKMVVVL